MKKYLMMLSLIAGSVFCQQPVEVNYDHVNRDFQTQLSQMFQEFAASQSSQGNEVVITFYDNFGEPRVSYGTAGAPSYLRAISNYKVKFMRDRQLVSTIGVVYVGTYLEKDYSEGI